MDYWPTSDPGEIARFLSSLQSGQGGFSSFDYQGWDHATDAEFAGNLTYNDESNMFYSSYGTTIDGVATCIGVSIPGIINSDNGNVSILSDAGAKWMANASGRMERPLIDPIDILAGGLSSLRSILSKTATRSITSSGFRTFTKAEMALVKGGANSFPEANVIAKMLGTTKRVFHSTIKPLIKKDFAKELRRIGTTNPDIGIDDLGNILLKNPNTGKVISTNFPLNAYSL